jgi:hypothetical protein
VSFWIPTFIEDLTIQSDLVMGTVIMLIENINYTRFVNARESKRTFRIAFTDGTVLIREIESATELDADTEELTVSAPWPANRTVAEISRIEFLENVRLDTDSVVIRHENVIGRASVEVPVKVVFDV